MLGAHHHRGCDGPALGGCRSYGLAGDNRARTVMLLVGVRWCVLYLGDVR